MRYKVTKLEGDVMVPTGEEFEGDAMTANLKVDTLIRTTGISHGVKQIGDLEPTNDLDPPDPEASEKSSTGNAGLLEDPHHAHGEVPARISPVLTPTTSTHGEAPKPPREAKKPKAKPKK